MITRRPPSDQPLMRAMEIARTGDGPGVLYASNVPAPVAGPGEVLIRVAYAGLNRADVMQVAGTYLPPPGASPLPGLEVSGRIAALGEGVVGWSLGEEVCALLSGGGYGEYVNVPAAQVLPCPGHLTLQQAATLPEAAATAFMALAQEAQLQPGERVLLHGGSSGVGLMLAQVARAWGAQVFATAGGAEKCTFVRNLGVTPIDHQSAPFAEQLMKLTRNEGVDVIIDILGGPQLATHLKLLRPGGRLVFLAMLEGPHTDSIKLGSVLMKHLRISGTTLRSRSAEQKATIVHGVRERIWPHLASGAITPHIDSIFPLEEAEKAMNRMQERLHCGKILLEVAAK